MPLSRVNRPTNPTTVASSGNPNRSRASARVGRTSSAKRDTSMPLPEPPPITSPRPGAIRPSRSPTAIRLRLLKITWFAQRIATHSNDRNRRRRQPVAVSKRNPRTTYTRTGTRHSQAASIPSNPAFGVDALTIVGRSRRIMPDRRPQRPHIGDRRRLAHERKMLHPHARVPLVRLGRLDRGHDRRAATVTSKPVSTRWPSCPRTSTLEISSVSRYSTLVRDAPATSPLVVTHPTVAADRSLLPCSYSG